MAKHRAAAAVTGELPFERHPARAERGRVLPVGELWAGRAAGPARTLRVRITGHELASEGVRAGDQLVVDRDRRLREGSLVLVSVAGSLALRLCRESGGRTTLEPTGSLPLPFAAEPVPEVIGRVVGLVRRRGFHGETRPAPHEERDVAARPDASSLDFVHRIVSANVAEWTRIVDRARQQRARGPAALRAERALRWARRLGQSLHALAATYTSTANPRLRRALLVEAARLSRSMRDLARAEGWDAARIRPLAI